MGFGALLPATVARLERGQDLRKVLPDALLVNERARALRALDQVPQVAALAVLYDDVQLGGLLVDDAVVVAEDVRVAQLAEDVDLADDELLLLVGHLPVVELLPHHDLPVRDALDLVHGAEGAAPDLLELDILFHRQFGREGGDGREREEGGANCTNCHRSAEKNSVVNGCVSS